MKSARPLTSLRRSQVFMSIIEFPQAIADLTTADKRQSQPPSRPCQLCLIHFVPSKRSIFKCGHERTCRMCLNQLVDHCIEQNNVPRCVHSSGCQAEMNYPKNQALNLIEHPIRVRLDRMMRAKHRNNHKCTVPNCYGFIVNGTCDLCLTNLCECCRQLQHLGPCRAPPDIPDLQGVKACPNCGEGIERSEGCNQMRCVSCSYVFCYECLSKWDSSHHSCGDGISRGILGWLAEKFCAS